MVSGFGLGLGFRAWFRVILMYHIVSDASAQASMYGCWGSLAGSPFGKEMINFLTRWPPGPGPLGGWGGLMNLPSPWGTGLDSGSAQDWVRAHMVGQIIN